MPLLLCSRQNHPSASLALTGEPFLRVKPNWANKKTKKKEKKRKKGEWDHFLLTVLGGSAHRVVSWDQSWCEGRRMGTQPRALVWSRNAVLVAQPVSSTVMWNLTLAIMELLAKLCSSLRQGGRTWLSEKKGYTFEKISNICYLSLKKKYKLL